MKRIITITALLAASAAIALAQPPSATAKKQAQAVQVVAKTTTTYDTITIAPTQATVANDSLINARFDQIQEQIKELKNETRNAVRRELRSAQSDSGRIGNLFVRVLQNTIPMLPFVAGVLIAIFWFRYSYKKRMMRQELIYKYVDRGEQVPEWLARAEVSSEPAATNGTTTPSNKNAKMFLVFSIILAAITLIFMIGLVNAGSWQSVASLLASTGGLAFATIFCFRQYLKRTE